MQAPNGNGTQAPTDSSDSFDFKSWRYLKDKIMGNSYPTAPVPANAFEYKMDHDKRGKALIFNHKVFAPALELNQRNGTDVDKTNLELTFKFLGFDVTVFDDLTCKQVNETLRQIALQDHSNSDSIAIAVLSHGTADKIYAFDEPYKPEVLTQYFTADYCKTLAGKPKLFFILACRGDLFDEGTTLQLKRRRYATDGDNDSGIYKIPNQADFLMMYSTYPGYYSWRNSRSGSCFIQALCRVIAEHQSEVDALTMMTYVNREVATKFESNVPKDVTQHMKKQMPQVCHTLLRQIFFSKKSPQPVNGTLV